MTITEKMIRVAENWMEMIDVAREIAVSADSVAGTAVQKAEAVHNNLKEHINNSDVHTSAEEKNTWNNKADGNHSHDEYATQQNVSDVYQFAEDVASDLQGQINEKANKPTVFSYEYLSHEYEFNYMYNHDIRNGELTTLSFTFGNGEYQPDYTSGLSFDSGETPTAIDYTDSGILNWVGTDCVTSDGLSIFQPSANTHYDIVFYFNGVQFIGLVNGYVPAGGNEAI